MELPHVMLLIDDPRGSVIEPLAGETGVMEPLYDTDLMLGGGHVKGWRLTDSQMSRVANTLSALKSQEAMADKYGMADAARCCSPWETAIILWPPPKPATKI